MESTHRLRELGNAQLVAGLAEIVQRSNVLTAKLLAHLVELEGRMLHLQLGFSSLFAYCVDRLGMSEGTAGRRVAATRVCRLFPDALVRVAQGELHLCALCALAPYLNADNARELFAACQGKTRRQIDELVAVRFPRPDVRAQIRRLPAPAPAPALRIVAERAAHSSAGSVTERPHLHAGVGESADVSASSAVPEIPAPPFGVRSPAGGSERGPQRQLEPLSPDRYGVHFTADAELRDLIERARALASHRLAKGDLAGLVKLMAMSFVRQEEKRRFGTGAKPRAAGAKVKLHVPVERATPPGGGHSRRRVRYLSVAVRRGAHARDGGQCAFDSADGRRCDSRAYLEFDHVEPFARLGSDDLPNIRLLCKAHNLLHARNCFGALHVAAKIAARRRRDSAQK